MKCDVVVIGSGVAGLVSSLKLSAKGLKVVLLDKQPIPGGFATGFKRKGFTFESALHCVDALGEKGEIRVFLDEYGITEKLHFIKLKDFCRIIYPDYDFVADFDKIKFIEYLKYKFLSQRQGIERLFEEFDKFFDEFDHFCSSSLPQWMKFAISPWRYRRIIKASTITVEKFISAYIKDVRLKALVCSIWLYLGLPPSRLSAFYFLLIFRGFFYDSTAYIEGGFGRLFEVMLDKIKEQGAEVQFNTEAKGIVTGGRGKVQAVVTDKGERLVTKAVISNANALDTLCSLIDDERVIKTSRRKLSGWEKSISAFQVYLGLRIPAKDLGMNHFMFSINKGYNHDENYKSSLYGDYSQSPLVIVDHAQLDPTLAPAGKGTLLIMVLDNYANWGNLSKDNYREKKLTAATTLVRRAEQYLPGLSGCIEVLEAATPQTMLRFGSSPEGAIYGFAQTVPQAGINRLSQDTSVRGLFLAGAWTMPGAGVHGCFVSGMDAADLVLRYLGKE